MSWPSQNKSSPCRFHRQPLRVETHISGIESSLSPCRRSLSQASAQDTHWPHWQHRDSASQPAVPHEAEHKPFGGQPTHAKPRCRKACTHHNKQRITTKATRPDNVSMIRKALKLPHPGAQHAESTFSKRSRVRSTTQYLSGDVSGKRAERFAELAGTADRHVRLGKAGGIQEFFVFTHFPRLFAGSHSYQRTVPG